MQRGRGESVRQDPDFILKVTRNSHCGSGGRGQAGHGHTDKGQKPERPVGRGCIENVEELWS